MPKKYHIKTKTTPPKHTPVGKYATLEFREDCAGACIRCVQKRCVYTVFQKEKKHYSEMNPGEYLYACNSCFRCVQECTKGIFSRVINPEYKGMGDTHWKPDIIQSLWAQSHTGKIPVSGAGYRGPFVGEGFDSMWTDMSEIVRPTRDGIHGREYINTSVELSRRAKRLQFDVNMNIISDLPPIMEVPIPLMFNQPDFGDTDNMLEASIEAAAELGTMIFIKYDRINDRFMEFAKYIVPVIDKDIPGNYGDIAGKFRIIEIWDKAGIEKDLEELRKLNPGLIISVAIPMNGLSSKRAIDLAEYTDILHFYADNNGREPGIDNPRHMKELIREIHLGLVNNNKRLKVNLLFSGGIAMAEHMAKAIICGADCVTVGIPLLIAMECRVCGRCSNGKSCPVEIENVDPAWGKQRILNLTSSWRNQLIEVMGAMGIREVRRLRGEVGRSMSFEDLERECFGPIFGERKVSGLG